MVYQLVYVSAAKSLMSEAQLAEVLIKARRNNERLGVTGLLIHQNGSFLQVLEGPAATVEDLFARISLDVRHRRVTLLARGADAKPLFADWSMGFADSASSVLNDLDGFRDFSRGRLDVGSLTKVRSRASFLIDAFSVGRLHQYVQV